MFKKIQIYDYFHATLASESTVQTSLVWVDWMFMLAWRGQMGTDVEILVGEGPGVEGELLN